LTGSVLEYVKKVKYIGVLLVSGRIFRYCFDHVKSQFCGSFNTTVHKVENAASELVCVQLLKSVCLPVILYALEAVSPTRTAINMLDNLINRAVYRMFNYTCQDNILYIRSMFQLSHLHDVVQTRTSTFLVHYQRDVPFGELVVKYVDGHVSFI